MQRGGLGGLWRSFRRALARRTRASAAAPLSREEIAVLARQTIAAVGARGPVDQERVMGYLMPHLRGRAEGAQVAAVVGDLLARLGDP